MNGIVVTLLAVLSQLAPTLGASSIGKIVTTLIQLLPTFIKVGEELVPPIKNIIAALSANPETTDEQLKQLENLDAIVDAAFEEAAIAAEAEDANASSQGV